MIRRISIVCACLALAAPAFAAEGAVGGPSARTNPPRQTAGKIGGPATPPHTRAGSTYNHMGARR